MRACWLLLVAVASGAGNTSSPTTSPPSFLPQLPTQMPPPPSTTPLPTNGVSVAPSPMATGQPSTAKPTNPRPSIVPSNMVQMPTPQPAGPPPNPPTVAAPTKAPKLSNVILLRELFPARSSISTSFSNQLPRNWCAPDTVTSQPTPWSFRRRRGSIDGVDNTTDYSDILVPPAEGDWFRFTGQVNISCYDYSKCNAAMPPSLTTLLECTENYLYMGPWSFITSAPTPFGGHTVPCYQASFVYEYRYQPGKDCGLYYGSSPANFTNGRFGIDFGVNFKNNNITSDELADYWNAGLQPLLVEWLTNTNTQTSMALVAQLKVAAIGKGPYAALSFCGLPFIQCLSIPSTNVSFSDDRLMLTMAHPEVYTPGSRPMGDGLTYLLDYTQVTGYAVLLGGDATSSLTSLNPIVWNSTKARNDWYDILNAMFMLDLSFNPNLQFGLNAPLSLRILLLTGSPHIELQWDGDNTLGATANDNITNPNTDCTPAKCVSSGLDFWNMNGNGEGGRHPPNLEVLSVSIDRTNWNGFYLRNLANLSVLQVDDSDYSYTYPYQLLSTVSSTVPPTPTPLSVFTTTTPSPTLSDLSQLVSDFWPVSVLPRYDESCRDMYFDRYFSYGSSLFSAANLPVDWNRTDAALLPPSPSLSSPSLSVTTKIPSFDLFCLADNNNKMSIKHFSVLGLPVSVFQNNNCLHLSSLRTFQLEGTQIMNLSTFFPQNTTTTASLTMIRLAHNILLSDISSLFLQQQQISVKNLLVYGNSRLNYIFPSNNAPSFASVTYVDASFSENFGQQQWANLSTFLLNAKKFTCRNCGIFLWPEQKYVPNITHLRLPMNPGLSFNMSEIRSDNSSNNNNNNNISFVEQFFNDFSTKLLYLDLSYCDIQGSFLQTQYSFFPQNTSFAYNALMSFNPSTNYDNISMFNTNISSSSSNSGNSNATVLFGTKALNLRGNLFLGPEPAFYNANISSLLDISFNQISCDDTSAQASVCSGNSNSKYKNSNFFPPRCLSCSSSYCSSAVIRNALPRIISSLEITKFEFPLEKNNIYNYDCLNASVFSPGLPCPQGGFCAYLKTSSSSSSSSSSGSSGYGNTDNNNNNNALLNSINLNIAIPPFAIIENISEINNTYMTMRFSIPRFLNMSDVCTTTNQMAIIKNNIVVGCELNLEVWLGNSSKIKKFIVLPPIMLYAQCGGGKYINDAGNCVPCLLGFFSPVPDAYSFSSLTTATATAATTTTASSTDSGTCMSCPPGATTADVGSTSFSQCMCANGTYGEPLNPQKCNYNSNNNVPCCFPCPAFAVCVNKATLPFPLNGYIRDNNDNTKILQCIPSTACFNNTCTDGYKGNGCSQCEKHFYRIQQICTACPPANGLIIFMGLLIFFGGSLFLLKGSKPSINKIFSISITVGFVQIISIFASFPVTWPAAATVMFDIFSFVNFNIELFSPECALDLTFYEKWGLKMLMPVMLFVFFSLILILVKCVPRLRQIYIKFLLWQMVGDIINKVPKRFRNITSLKQLRRREEDEEDGETNEEEGQEMVVVRQTNPISSLSSASSPASSADMNMGLRRSEVGQISFGVEKVSPRSAADQYEIDRAWEDAHINSRFVHAFVTSCCLGYTFLAKTSTQLYNCVDTGGVSQVLRYDPSIACYDNTWYMMQIPGVLALLIYTFGIPVFFTVILFRAYRRDEIESANFFAHFGQLVLPYRSQYWYWELVQIGRKLITVLLIDFGANAEGNNTYSQITGVFVVLLIFLVLQEFIKPYEFTWCNRLAFSWTVVSLMVVVSALFFVQSTLSTTQRSQYGIALLFSCIIGFAIAIYTARLEQSRASAKTRVASGKDFLAAGQEEQTVVNTIFGKNIGEPLYRKTRGLHPTARAAFYQRLVRLHSSASEVDMQSSSVTRAPEAEIAQLRVRLSQLESKTSERPSSAVSIENDDSFAPVKPPPLLLSTTVRPPSLSPSSSPSLSPPPYVAHTSV